MRTVLAGALLLCATAAAQERPEVARGLGEMADAALDERASFLWRVRDEAVLALRSADQLKQRQARVRARVLEALGGFPGERTPLRARVTRTLERDEYRVEMLVYESLPGLRVTANVYVPRGRPPYPAVLGVAGHSANGKASATYQHAWVSLARRGFLVLAYDPPGQGERSLYYDPDLGRSRVGIGTREHDASGLQCLLTGHHFARYELWDGIRGIDYLLTRTDVDPSRIGVAGNSGGGTQAALLAVVEPRLAAVVSSCYMTSWKQLWFDPGPQDAEQVLPGFLADGFDFADFALAAAPRPFQILSATRDFFPIAGARAAHAEARSWYERLGYPERVDFFEYDDPHGWSQPRREATYRWLERWLLGRADSAREAPVQTELESDLYATPTGQVATSFEAVETVQSLNRRVAETLFPQRAALGLEAGRLQAVVRSRLRIEAEAAVPVVRPAGELLRDGYRIEKLLLETGPTVLVPALAFVPAAGPARRPAVLYVDGAGKSADAGGDVESLVRSGHVVLSVDPRGVGESRPTRGGGGYDPAWQLLQRALLVDRTVVGLQLEDLQAGLAALASRPDVDPARIGVLGKGHGGLLALALGMLQPRIEKVAVEGSLLSYLELARAPLHEGLTTAFVPGVLRDFDLPDLAAALAPRPLWVVDPRTPTGALVARERARAEHAQAVRAYERAGRAGAFRVVHRPEGWPFDRVYAEWLRAEPAPLTAP